MKYLFTLLLSTNVKEQRRINVCVDKARVLAATSRMGVWSALIMFCARVSYDNRLTKYSANCVGVPPSIVPHEKWPIRIVPEQMRAVRVITLCFRYKYDKKFAVKKLKFSLPPS